MIDRPQHRRPTHRRPDCKASSSAAPDAASACASRLARRIAHLPARIRRGPCWLLGFSHGADSTALLALLSALRSERHGELGFELPELRAVTIDHGLRDRAELARELESARAVARALEVRHEVVRVRCARPSETAARDARYAAFADLARRSRASALLLAHHARDQRETLVLRLLRGTGPLGLCGMPARRRLAGSSCTLVRPLLREDPATLRAVLAERGLPHVEDPSNADAAWTLRNRVRHEVLPALEDARPGALDALAREARALRRAVRHELRAWNARTPSPERLAFARTEAAPTREVYAVEALTRLGFRQPTRKLARRLAGLLTADARRGSIVESRGHWRAQRMRDHVALEAFAPALSDARPN